MDIVERIHKLESLLSSEGPRSKRAFALFCAERVAHLNTVPRVAKRLAIVRRRVADPASVTDIELERASDAAYAACAAAAAACAAAAADCAAVSHAATDAAVAVATDAASAADAAASRDTRNMERRVQEAWLVFTNGFVSFP